MASAAGTETSDGVHGACQYLDSKAIKELRMLVLHNGRAKNRHSPMQAARAVALRQNIRQMRGMTAPPQATPA